MDQFIEQLNQWGKDSILQYGLVDTIVIIVLILLTAVIISKLLTRLMKRQNFRNLPIWLKLKKYVMIIITIYSILTLFIPAKTILSPLLASGGIVAVVIGLAAQETVGNLISGFMIITFRPFHIGDLIRVNNGEYVGTVVEITVRHHFAKSGLFNINSFDLEDNGSGAVIAAGNHDFIIICPSMHDRSALQCGINISADGVPCF